MSIKAVPDRMDFPYLLQVKDLDVVVESLTTDDDVVSPGSDFSPSAGLCALGLSNTTEVS